MANVFSVASARFLTSAETLRQCPSDDGCEIAFAGRSNAGKSSALNALAGQNRLARASKTPGRTRLINFFELSAPGARLVDLPGYGYARVSRAMQEKWQRNLQHYLEARMSLAALVLVMDIRHPLKPMDEMLLQWCANRGLLTRVLLTKADKVSKGEAARTCQQVQKHLKSYPDGFSCQAFSATRKQGLDTLEPWLQSVWQAVET